MSAIDPQAKLARNAAKSATRIQRKNDGQRLTKSKTVAILALHRLGKTQVEIAQTIGLTDDTVRTTLDKLLDMRPLARSLIDHNSDRMAERLITEGDSEVLRKTLTQIEVLPPMKTEGDSRVVVQVGIAVAEAQQPPESWLQAHPAEGEIVENVKENGTLPPSGEKPKALGSPILWHGEDASGLALRRQRDREALDRDEPLEFLDTTRPAQP